jgi:hypothetical protein
LLINSPSSLTTDYEQLTTKTQSTPTKKGRNYFPPFYLKLPVAAVLAELVNNKAVTNVK